MVAVSSSADPTLPGATTPAAPDSISAALLIRPRFMSPGCQRCTGWRSPGSRQDVRSYPDPLDPTAGNVHEVAQGVDPVAWVVYVDTDPVAVAHGQQLLHGNDRATAIAADLRDPQSILAHRRLRQTLDLAAPVGLLIVSVLHFLDDEDAYPAVAELRAALPPG